MQLSIIILLIKLIYLVEGHLAWTKYNKDGAIDTSWGTSGHKTGKTLSVSNTDVTTKATFMVEVVL